jgi:hypothetical protein
MSSEHHYSANPDAYAEHSCDPKFHAFTGTKCECPTPAIRKFETGATRDVDVNKFDYEGFYNPLVVERFAEYMHKHRVQPDGNLRDADNWQKGIPKDAYMKSGFRHFMDMWKQHRGYQGQDDLEESICALIFNAQGYLYELLKARNAGKEDGKRDSGVR